MRRDATKACASAAACFRKPLTLRQGSDHSVAIPDDVRAGRAALAIDSAGTAYLAYGVRPVSASAPAEPSALSHVLTPGGGSVRRSRCRRASAA